ncbi:hypothetical protein RRG08_049427 [Elysia crispata]|uniref:Uncharacterized protein n=1 Tax=Elysia crispata TaxID=231223 RepID=A0AAE0ZT51_9GAST|nr:hypothetical protein RRG08_049427 [Elysia crispata]
MISERPPKSSSIIDDLLVSYQVSSFKFTSTRVMSYIKCVCGPTVLPYKNQLPRRHLAPSPSVAFSAKADVADIRVSMSPELNRS